MHVYACLRASERAFARALVASDICMFMYVVCAQWGICMYVHIYVRTHKHMHAHTHTHTHTHTHEHAKLVSVPHQLVTVSLEYTY